MNSRILQPPNNYENEFNWIIYLRECQALPAPKHNFISTKNINVSDRKIQFYTGKDEFSSTYVVCNPLGNLKYILNCEM